MDYFNVHFHVVFYLIVSIWAHSSFKFRYALPGCVAQSAQREVKTSRVFRKDRDLLDLKHATPMPITRRLQFTQENLFWQKHIAR